VPHRCLRCGTLIESKDDSLIKEGCPRCGSRLFIYEPERRKSRSEDFEFVDIRVERDGVYSIDLESITDDDNVIVVYKDGVYHILLLNEEQRPDGE